MSINPDTQAFRAACASIKPDTVSPVLTVCHRSYLSLDHIIHQISSNHTPLSHIKMVVVRHDPMAALDFRCDRKCDRLGEEKVVINRK